MPRYWPFNKYPGTDYETYNWDWLIKVGKRMEQVISDLFSDTGALHQMVDKVLGEHPEWTTTVMDGAISTAKLMNDAVTRNKLSEDAYESNYLDLKFTKKTHTSNIGNGGTTTYYYCIVPRDYKPKLVYKSGAAQAETLAAETKASILINAGICDSNKIPRGYTYYDGTVITNTPIGADYSTAMAPETLVCDKNGILSAVDSYATFNQTVNENTDWCVQGWASFVNNGIMTANSPYSTYYYPRTWIAQNASGDYFVATCEGRAYNQRGMCCTDMYNAMVESGFVPNFAYYLDGGGSVAAIENGARVNKPIMGEYRTIPTAIYFAKELSKYDESAPSVSNAFSDQLHNLEPEPDAIRATQLKQFAYDATRDIQHQFWRVTAHEDEQLHEYEYERKMSIGFSDTTGVYLDADVNGQYKTVSGFRFDGSNVKGYIENAGNEIVTRSTTIATSPTITPTSPLGAVYGGVNYCGNLIVINCEVVVNTDSTPTTLLLTNIPKSYRNIYGLTAWDGNGNPYKMYTQVNSGLYLSSNAVTNGTHVYINIAYYGNPNELTS